jgi:protein arginine N-methyltransferase 1
MSVQLDEHRQLIGDQHRVKALSRAIGTVVRPGDVVLDVASGTGILGLLACRAGASRVYCIEQTGIIELARHLARANGFADRMHFIMANSAAADLPELVDVIVSDQIGHFGFDAGIMEMLADVHVRCLKPQGRMMPAGITLFVGLAELPGLRAELDFWTTPLAGFDFSPGGDIAANSGHPISLEPECLLGPGVDACYIDLSIAGELPFGFTAALTASRDGVVDGIAGWFLADLAIGVTMTNGPGCVERIDRRNVVFPLDEPVAVRARDEVTVAMRIRPSDLIVQWDVSVRGERRCSHSTFAGMLLPREALTRTHPQTVPHLTLRGEARKTVLTLCDGGRTLDGIERETYSLHRNLFRNYADAQVFVAEVVTRYSQG